MENPQRSKRSLFGGQRRRSQIALEQAAAAAVAAVAAYESGAGDEDGAPNRGPPPVPAAATRRDARDAPPPIPERPNSAQSSPEVLNRTASPPGWPSLHTDLIPPLENDDFVSPQTNSYQSAQSSPVVDDNGGWQLQASPHGGSLMLPGTPAALAATQQPRGASSLARSLSALSAGPSPAATRSVSPQSPKQLAAAAAMADARAAVDAAEAVTGNAARTMEIARQTARLRRERQLQSEAEDEARRSLDAARRTIPTHSPRGPPQPAPVDLPPPVAFHSVVPDDAPEEDVSMALAAGDAISSLLTYIQSAKEAVAQPRLQPLPLPLPQASSPLQQQQRPIESAFPSPSGLTFAPRSPEPPPPRSPEPAPEPPVIELSDSEDDDDGSIDPELWARSVSTALAFRCFRQGIRASQKESQPEPEPEPEPWYEPMVVEKDEENIAPAPVGGSSGQRQLSASAAGQLRVLQGNAFQKGNSKSALLQERKGEGVLKTQVNRTTVVASPGVTQLAGQDVAGGRLVSKRADRTTHVAAKQPGEGRVAEQPERAENYAGVSVSEEDREYEEYLEQMEGGGTRDALQDENEYEGPQLHWSRRAGGGAALTAAAPRTRRKAMAMASPHKAAFAVRVVSGSPADAKKDVLADVEQKELTTAQVAKAEANAKLRSDRERRARSASVQKRRAASPAPQREVGPAREMTPQEIAKAEFRSYRRAMQAQGGVTDSGSWQAEREAYLEFQRTQLEEQREAECTGKPDLKGSFAAAVTTAVAAAVEAAVESEKTHRSEEKEKRTRSERERVRKRASVKTAARAVARARSPSPEKEAEVVQRQRANIERETAAMGAGQAKAARRVAKAERLTRSLAAAAVAAAAAAQQQDYRQIREEQDVTGAGDGHRSVSRQRQADLAEKLSALEDFRMENMRLETELQEAKQREQQNRLAKRPTTPGERQRAWAAGRQEQELLNALEERTAAGAREKAKAEARAAARELDRQARRDEKYRSPR